MKTLPNEIIYIVLENLEFQTLIKFGSAFNFITYKQYNPNIHDWELAVTEGNLDLIKFLHYNNIKGYSLYSMNEAAANGHLEVVKWLQQNRTEGSSKWAMVCAAEHGQIEVVKYLHMLRKGCCTKWAMDCAAYNGHLEVVKLLSKSL